MSPAAQLSEAKIQNVDLQIKEEIGMSESLSKAIYETKPESLQQVAVE